MKIIKIAIAIVLLLFILINCTTIKKETTFDLLQKGQWHTEWDQTRDYYLITFMKSDSGFMAVLDTKGVLFKNIKFVSDSSFTCKGQFSESIYRTENVLKYGWTGSHWGNYYEEQRVLDHVNTKYVDYRMVIEKDGTLTFYPFSEGSTEVFYGPVTRQEVQTKLDSFRRIDSLEMIKAEQNRIIQSNKRAQEELRAKEKKAQEFLK